MQTSRAGAKPLLVTLLKAVGELFVATQQAACLDMLATIAEVFGEVKGAPELAAAQQQALEGRCPQGWPIILDKATFFLCVVGSAWQVSF